MKTIAEQIADLEKLLATQKDKLVQATKGLESAEAEDVEAFEAAVVEGTALVEKTVARLESLRRAEKALGTQATRVEAAPSIVKSGSKSADTDNLFGKVALIEFESRVKGVSKEAVIQQRFGDSEVVRSIVKSVSNPAMSDVPGYAQELTQTAYGQFMDLLREESLLARCVPLSQQHRFGQGVSSIYIPKRTGSPTQAAGAFRAEGSPIPVKGLTFTSQTLTPKNLGVILTATAEMLRRSSLDLASYFQKAMVSDTGTSLDALFVSDTAGSVIAPAGIRNGVAGGDTRPASGTGTNADIVTDLKACLTAMSQQFMGSNSSTRWVMSPKNWYTVSMSLTATGARQFPETANGVLVGIPVIVTTNMADTEVLLVDFNEISMGIGAPTFLASEVATLHEETAPEPISTVATPNEVAAPIRSLYQTNSWALRLLMDADWAKMRAGGLVQELTAVAWVG
jgi:HK97 family phage major capsid protein